MCKYFNDLLRLVKNVKIANVHIFHCTVFAGFLCLCLPLNFGVTHHWTTKEKLNYESINLKNKCRDS